MFQNEAWIHRLARRLVADEARANELVQIVYTEALEKKPNNPRPWIALVLKRASWRMKSSEARRKHRENAVAADRGEALTPQISEAERKDTKRKLVSFIQSLDEPYRSTMMLHFFEELDFAEIARRQGVPYATVQTRVRRGLAQLRARLTAQYGDPSRWVFALAPIAGAMDVKRDGSEKSNSWKALSGVAAIFLLGGAILLTGLIDSSHTSRTETISSTIRFPEIGLEPHENVGSEANAEDFRREGISKSADTTPSEQHISNEGPAAPSSATQKAGPKPDLFNANTNEGSLQSPKKGKGQKKHAAPNSGSVLGRPSAGARSLKSRSETGNGEGSL